MKAVLFPIALLASVAAAQTTTAGAATGTGSACAAETIVETCLDTENTQFNTCGTNDWDCKCAAYNAIVTYVFPPSPFSLLPTYLNLPHP